MRENKIENQLKYYWKYKKRYKLKKANYRTLRTQSCIYERKTNSYILTKNCIYPYREKSLEEYSTKTSTVVPNGDEITGGT